MIEMLTLAIGLGLAVSFLFSEFFGMAGAGLVVPGYIALYLTRPVTVGLTLAAAFATFACVRALSSFVIIFGRRRTLLMILVGYLMALAFRTVSQNAFPGDTSDYTVIGFIIPGLIANCLDRHGAWATLSSLLATSVVVRLILVIFAGEALQTA